MLKVIHFNTNQIRTN